MFLPLRSVQAIRRQAVDRQTARSEIALSSNVSLSHSLAEAVGEAGPAWTLGTWVISDGRLLPRTFPMHRFAE